jgi:hypothetical protein
MKCDWLQSQLQQRFCPFHAGCGRKKSKEQNITHDHIQYVAYDLICSSFLLNLINKESDRQSAISFRFAVSHEETEDAITKCIRENLMEN